MARECKCPKGERKHALLVKLARATSQRHRWGPRCQDINVRGCVWAGESAVWRGGPGEGRKWGPLSRGERIECSPIPAWYYNHQHRCLQARIALQSQPKWHQYAMCRSGGEGRAETCSPLLAGVVTSAGHCRRSTALQIRSVAPYGTSVPKWGVCQTFGQWVK
jgi:hypothetical protein